MQWHMPIGYKVVDGKITICEERYLQTMIEIKTEQGLIEQIKRIQSIIDDIVPNKEISQLKNV